MSKDTQLHEVIAVEPTIKVKADNILKECHETFHKRQGHFKGMIKKYTPSIEDGEKFPDESKELVTTVMDKLSYTFKAIIEKIDVVSTKEESNINATSDVVVDGKTMFESLHATTILALEKEIAKWRPVINVIPTLEPGIKWNENKGQQLWESDPIITAKPKKVPKVLVKYDATKEHPAQTELIHEDQTIGHWKTIHTSGAITPKQKSEILGRLDKLERAFKIARQRANTAPVKQENIGEQIVTYLFDTNILN